MVSPVDVLLSAALARTGMEAVVWDLAAGRMSRMGPDGATMVTEDGRASLLGGADPEEREAFEQALDEAIERRAPLEHEYRTGGRWMCITAEFHGDLLAGTIADISAEKQRRSAFEQIVENVPDFIARVDLDGRFLYLNRATENNAFGLPREALLGKTPQELGFNPETWSLLREAELRVIESGKQQRIELDLTQMTGRMLDVLMLPERDDEGRIVSLLRVTRDVTALKKSEQRWRESEERLRLAARASLAMIYDWDMVTGKTYRSEAVRDLTGFSPEETERSEWWLSEIHPDDREQAEALVQEASEKGEDRFDNEYRVRHRDGSWRYVWDRGFILRDRSGRAVRVVGSTVDVTARRLAEEELKSAHHREREARAEAEHANRAKDEFLANLSHELRTPMTSILGWTSMLSAGMVEPETMPLAVNSIHTSARAQAQLIEDLLDITRIASGKLSVETGPVDLVSVVASCVESFRVTAAAHSVELHVAIDCAGVVIVGDEKRMRQIIANLVNNALKFTPAGGRVDVALTCQDGDAVVIVRDTGSGIDPAFLPHVFDRFAQQEPGDSRAHGGLGLGLAIVRQLVELHDGSVSAKSDGRGLGSVFTVRLPRLDGRLRSTSHPTLTGRSAPRLDGVRILLVEDEPHSRQYMESVFLSSGAEVRAAASVAEALLEEGEPSIVVSDIAMPGEDGLALIARLRSRDALRGCRTPAVAVTALGFGDDRRRILSAGFDEYLAKPVEPLVLLETVASLVRR